MGLCQSNQTYGYDYGNDTEMALLLKSLQYVALSEHLGDKISVHRKAGVIFLCQNIWQGSHLQITGGHSTCLLSSWV